MRKNRRGFTLIEVVLFLGLTSALFLGIAVGVQNSVFQQRYNDSVQSFAEFLRSVYSQVANVQNEKYGREPNKAIYGKVITFDVTGDGDEKRNLIKTYNLIGDIKQDPIEEVEFSNDAGCKGTDSVIDRLCNLKASIMYLDSEVTGTGLSLYSPVGFVETYEPRWDARIQTTTGYDDDSGYDLFRGIVIITHSPSSGNISTYVLQDSRNPGNTETINKILKQIRDCEDDMTNGTCQIAGDDYNPFNEVVSGAVQEHYLNSDNFTTEPIDFCVNPNGLERSTIRRDVRIDSGTHNASGVEVIVEERNPDEYLDTGVLNRCAI